MERMKSRIILLRVLKSIPIFLSDFDLVKDFLASLERGYF
jgi:hypothetical protein